MLLHFQKYLFQTACSSFNKKSGKKVSTLVLYIHLAKQLQGTNSFHRFGIWDIVVQCAKYPICYYQKKLYAIISNSNKFLIAFAQ